MKKKNNFKIFPWVVCVLSGENYLKESTLAEKQGADCLEIRFDLINERAESIAKKIREKTNLPLIATFRVVEEGGKINSNVNRYELFFSVINYIDLVDIELNFMDKTIIYLTHKNKKKLIISYHNFNEMPTTIVLNKIILKAKKYNPFIIKIAFKTSSDEQVTKLLQFLSDNKNKLAVMALGEKAQASRIAAPILGSCLTYGYIGKATAEGQFSVRELVEQLKIFTRISKKELVL